MMEVVKVRVGILETLSLRICSTKDLRHPRCSTAKKIFIEVERFFLLQILMNVIRTLDPVLYNIKNAKTTQDLTLANA